MISQNRNLVFDWRLFGLSFLTFLSVKYLLKFEAIFKNDKAVAQEDGKRRSHLILSWCLCLILFTSLSIACCVENRKRAKPDIEKIKKYHEVQLWAREHTRNEASFVLVNPTINSAWRTYTGRPVIAYKEIIQVYCSTMQIVDFNTRLKRFKELHPPVFRKEKGDAEDFNTANWLAFAKEFGADYMVRRKDWPPLELPVEFQNSEFVIYRLKTSN
ncbi:MAG: hypothetical protein IPM93_23250 [Candidatus Obscuribacter sp.]|nr:hypothetical protein [Candidatus Obscuribacter sp.]